MTDKEIVSFIMKEKYKRRNEILVVLINKDIERNVKYLIVEWKENHPCLISHNRTLCGLPVVVTEVDDVKVVTFKEYKEMIESDDKEYKVEVITRGNCMMCGKELTKGLFFCKECEDKARRNKNGGTT